MNSLCFVPTSKLICCTKIENTFCIDIATISKLNFNCTRNFYSNDIRCGFAPRDFRFMMLVSRRIYIFFSCVMLNFNEFSFLSQMVLKVFVHICATLILRMRYAALPFEQKGNKLLIIYSTLYLNFA